MTRGHTRLVIDRVFSGRVFFRIKRKIMADSRIVRYWNHYPDPEFMGYGNKRAKCAVVVHTDKKLGNASIFSFGLSGLRPIGIKAEDMVVHKLDVASRTLSFVKTKSKLDDPLLAPCDKFRSGHSACNYNGKIYLYGGREKDTILMKEVSCFDVATSS